jgi:DNA-binding NarL/FixJ family response regulator
MTDVVLADDHVSVRQSLALVLKLDGRYRVVGEAGNGLEALEMVLRVQPQVASCTY